MDVVSARCSSATCLGSRRLLKAALGRQEGPAHNPLVNSPSTPRSLFRWRQPVRGTILLID